MSTLVGTIVYTVLGLISGSAVELSTRAIQRRDTERVLLYLGFQIAISIIILLLIFYLTNLNRASFLDQFLFTGLFFTSQQSLRDNISASLDSIISSTNVSSSSGATANLLEKKETTL